MYKMESSKPMDPDIRALFSTGRSSKCLIDREEVEGALASLCLNSVSYGGYLLIMRSECDVILSDEPHIALIMWLNLETGRFFARIWSQTVTTGSVKDMSEFLEICRAHFMSGKPCLGLPVSNNMNSDTAFIVSHSPIPRRISIKCKKTLGQGTSIDVQSCTECLKLEDVKESADYKVQCKTEVFANEDSSHIYEGDALHPEVEYMVTEPEIKFEDDDPVCYDASIANTLVEDDLKIFKKHPSLIDEDYVEDPKGVNEFILDRYSDEVLKAKKQSYHYSKKHTCPWCTFNKIGDKKLHFSRAKLENHMKRKHFWGTFSCPQCEHIAYFATDLIAHMKQEGHLEETDVKCPQCKDNFPLAEIQGHYKYCIYKQILVCPLCPNMLFDRSQDLEFIEHKKKVHLWGNFSCMLCNFKTEFSKDLVKHVGEHSETAFVECPECCVELTSLEIESHYKACVTTAINNTCHWCSKRFASYSACQTHKKMVHFWNKFKCERCAHKANFAEELIDHMEKEDHKGPVTCPNCKNMISTAEFVSHYKECLRGKWLKCQWCSKVFTSLSGTFFTHRRKVHFWGIFKCPQCDIVKNFAQDLLSHMEEENHFQHSNIKCPYCASMVSFIDIVTHYKECIADLGKKDGFSKSSKCHKCKQKFPKDEILSHQRTCKPGVKGDPKWECTYCDLKLDLTQTHEQKRHKVMTHHWGEFVCPNCEAKYGFAKDLLQHMVDKMHDAPVRCPECMDLIQTGLIEGHYKACAGTWTFSRDKEEVLKEEILEEGNHVQEEQKRLHRCEVCNKGYVTTSRLKAHVEKEHEGKDAAEQCPYCDKTFKINSDHFLWRHKMIVHGRGDFQCPTCKEKVSLAAELKRHMLEEDHITEEDIECPSCYGKVDLKGLEEHFNECVKKPISLLLQMRKSRVSSRLPGDNVPAIDNSINGDILKPAAKERLKNKERLQKVLKCPWCPFETKWWGTLIKHKKLTHFWGQFQCRECKEPADFADSLVKHMELEGHTKDPSVHCPACEESISMSQILPHYKECVPIHVKLKQRLTHEGRRARTLCTICGKSIAKFQVKYHMEMHMRQQGLTNEEAKTNLYHYCEKCGKQFISLTKMKEHMQVVHEGIRFTCTTCNISFLSKRHLTVHNAKEHSIGNVFQCELCSYRGHRSELTYHMKVHGKFKCRHCGKVVKTKDNLTAHERIHTGEKPFPCSRCDSSFASTKGLSQHMRGVHKVAPRGGQTGWYRKQKSKS